MSRAVISVGTNMGDRVSNIEFAVRALTKLPGVRVTAVSGVYETPPWGYENQPDFLNACIMTEADISPAMLLGGCLGIEAAMGRVRAMKNGPRILDLDLILYEGIKADTFEMTIPHPRALERAFVLVPLSEFYPDGMAPGLCFAHALRDMDTSGIRLTDYKITIPEVL